ncbi:histone acetylase complex subunit [Naviculisporaceae sp. PSN 640]
MAPPKEKDQKVPPFSKDEKVMCFHLEMLYEAKILDVKPNDNGGGFLYKIHYKGWKSSWDDWVPEDRVRKFTDENRELASTLAQQSKALKTSTKSGGAKGKGGGGRGAGAAGSDLSSARGSEERTAGTTTQNARGPRRARDFELETVSIFFFSFFLSSCDFSSSEWPLSL